MNSDRATFRVMCDGSTMETTPFMSETNESQVGKYSKSFITDVPMVPGDENYLRFKNSIIKYPLEGIYIYSFEKGRMIYADGWDNVVGYSSAEINMLQIVQMTSPDFAPFVHEINDKALMFLHERNERLTEYFFQIEIKIMHKLGFPVPVIARVSVHDTHPDGSLRSIMGRFQVDHGLRFSKIMRFSAYGPEKDAFENNLNEGMFYPYRISEKELEVLRLLAKGMTYKEIAEHLGLSLSAIDKRIRPMFQRFEVKNNANLVAFGYEHNLLP